MEKTVVVTVSQFLRQYESENTRKAYTSSLRKFFATIYPDNGDDLDEMATRYFSEARDYRKDILDFRDSIAELAPKTKTLRLAGLKVFLDDNGISFPKRFFKNLNGKTKEALTYERVPTNDELRRIVEHMAVHGKALTLTLSSSGMRIGEAMALVDADLNLEAEPATVRIRAETSKTGRKRIVFVSPEAVEALKEWLKSRSRYSEAADKKAFRALRSDGDYEGRLFPFRAANFNVIWRVALDKAGLLEIDPATNRVMMRPHNLRKYFRLRVGRFGRDEAEALMGHQEGLNRVYARFEGEEGVRRLGEIYMKAIPDLSVYGRSVILNRAEKELRERLKKSEYVIDTLSIQKASLERRLDRAEERLEERDLEVREMFDRLVEVSAEVKDLKHELDGIKVLTEGADGAIVYTDELAKAEAVERLRAELKARADRLRRLREEDPGYGRADRR